MKVNPLLTNPSPGSLIRTPKSGQKNKRPSPLLEVTFLQNEEIMSKLTESERKKLERNLNVLSIKEVSITYNPEFKIKAVKAYLSG
jgi:hypothetical protein